MFDLYTNFTPGLYWFISQLIYTPACCHTPYYAARWNLASWIFQGDYIYNTSNTLRYKIKTMASNTKEMLAVFCTAYKGLSDKKTNFGSACLC